MNIPVYFSFIFGGIPEFFLGGTLYIIFSILATIKALKFTTGAAVPVWLAFIWLVPCLGCLLALIAIKKPETHIDP